jgi:hypothetical protein
MIGNRGKPGVILWALNGAAEGAALDLARALDGKVVDGQKFMGFVGVADTTEQDLAKELEKKPLTKFGVGVSRITSEALERRLGLKEDDDLVIARLQGKTIQALWSLRVCKDYRKLRPTILADLEKAAPSPAANK